MFKWAFPRNWEYLESILRQHLYQGDYEANCRIVSFSGKCPVFQPSPHECHRSCLLLPERQKNTPRRYPPSPRQISQSSSVLLGETSVTFSYPWDYIYSVNLLKQFYPLVLLLPLLNFSAVFIRYKLFLIHLVLQQKIPQTE